MNYDLVISDNIEDKNGMRYFHYAYISALKDAEPKLAMAIASNYYDSSSLIIYPIFFSGGKTARLWRLVALYYRAFAVFSRYKRTLHHWYSTYLELPFSASDSS